MSAESFTKEELHIVISLAAKISTRDWAMILLAYLHGLRASEVCNLRLCDVDMQAGSITVARNKGSMLTVQPLCRSSDPEMDEVNALKRWLPLRTGDTEYLFTSQKRGPLSRVTFFKRFRDVAKAAGMPKEKQHPHTLKHSVARHLADDHASLGFIKYTLGHRASSSTEKYVTTHHLPNIRERSGKSSSSLRDRIMELEQRVAKLEGNSVRH